jgi:3-oxoadipate enol-lactonase
LHERPERLPRAVLQGAFARRPLRRAEWLLARMTRFLPGPMARVPFRRRILRAINHDTFAGRPPEVWANFLESSGRAPIASFAYQALMMHRLDLRPLLPSIRPPVLVVHGERDHVVPWPYAEELLRGLPNARCAVLEGCGHVPSYTHPEVLAEVVRQALSPPDRAHA